MATSDTGSLQSRVEYLQSLINESDVKPRWEEPADLSRLSMESMLQQNSPSRVLTSSGSIRLFGSAVTGHAAAISNVGAIMLHLQKTIDALAAAELGVTHSRGQLPGDLLSASRVDLVASPLPGSLTLAVRPHLSAIEELPQQRPIEETDHEKTQTVDRAMKRLVAILRRVSERDAVDDVLAEEIRAEGPRAASSIRSFAAEVAKAAFDTDFAWMQPHEPTDRACVTASEMRNLAAFIQRRDLDSETRELSGVVIRVAKEKTALVLEEDTGTPIRILRGKMSPEDLQSVRVDQYVTVLVEAKPFIKANGERGEDLEGLRVVSAS